MGHIHEQYFPWRIQAVDILLFCFISCVRYKILVPAIGVHLSPGSWAVKADDFWCNQHDAINIWDPCELQWTCVTKILIYKINILNFVQYICSSVLCVRLQANTYKYFRTFPESYFRKRKLLSTNLSLKDTQPFSLYLILLTHWSLNKLTFCS